MQSLIKKLRLLSPLLIAAAALSPATGSAALRTAAGPVVQPRVEGSVGLFLIGSFGGTCGSRAWMDVTTPQGKAQYSTALLAFAMGKTVVVRVEDEELRMFGECRLYDIVIN
ncbi:hypothetical protein [Roseateles aquatilis]|nr:hypothetical protein [Roseateles aquatilis]